MICEILWWGFVWFGGGGLWGLVVVFVKFDGGGL